MRNKKILYVDYGGLGDHLAFSTLPEICSKNNYDFYISKKSKFRHNEIYSLVWEINPYFNGLSDEEPNCGHGNYTNLEGYNYNISLHRNFEIKMGFGDCVLENKSEYPSIYYNPKKITKYENHILIDLNSFSLFDYNIDIIKNHIEKHNDSKILFILPTYSSSVLDINFFNHLNMTQIKTKDIFHYVDLIFSCKKFICLWSGSSVLSATIKNQYNKDLEIDCFKNYNIHPTFGTTDKTHFWYENITYIPA